MSKLLEPRGYDTLLIRGTEGPYEGTMDDLADELGVRPLRIASLQRELGLHDVAAVVDVARALRKFRPHVVHTHMAKAGTVGRVASQLLGPRRPRALVHTFHGQSLEGYFSPLRAGIFRATERGLARRTTRLVAVSAEIRADLVRLGISSPERIDVIPLGFDLARFAATREQREEARQRLRSEWAIPQSAPVATLVARLVPIKRVDRFLEVAAQTARRLPEARFVIVGDGELRDELPLLPDARWLGHRLTWAGLRRDIPEVLWASDAVLLTSDNEGTPVSLIEAQAAETPVVSTDVGGARSVVTHGRTGFLGAPDDTSGLADATVTLLRDPALRARFGRLGRERVEARFSVGRLCGDLDQLYRGLLQKGA